MANFVSFPQMKKGQAQVHAKSNSGRTICGRRITSDWIEVNSSVTCKICNKPRTYREIASVYGLSTPSGKISPVKVAVDVMRFTNSSTMGKGESRLLEIAKEKFEEFFGDERTWNLQEGYEHDIIEGKINLPLNTKCTWIAYRVAVYIATPEASSVGSGVERF